MSKRILYLQERLAKIEQKKISLRVGFFHQIINCFTKNINDKNLKNSRFCLFIVRKENKRKINNS